MTTSTRNGSFYFRCPHCDKTHAGELAKNRVYRPKNGIIRVLTTLPCKNKIIFFFSESQQLRGHECIDEVNVVDYKEDADSNYNDDYKKFMEDRGMYARLRARQGSPNA